MVDNSLKINQIQAKILGTWLQNLNAEILQMIKLHVYCNIVKVRTFWKLFKSYKELVKAFWSLLPKIELDLENHQL